MLYDFLQIDTKCKEPLYLQIYNFIKLAISKNELKQGDKLPSIRKLSEDIHVSKTTIESAYNQLAVEGFIINKPCKGYFVFVNTAGYAGVTKSIVSQENKYEKSIIKYDLSSKSVDIDLINLSLWRKYIKSVLNSEYLISSYGNPQGEASLRYALSKYCYSVRGVVANESNIVIGAGTQPLIYQLCGLLNNYGSTVAMEEKGFAHGERVFSDCSYTVARIPVDTQGIDINCLYNSGAKILYINPSGNLENSNSIKINRRYELLKWANDVNGIIIEDDHNGELRYRSHPIPAMQGNNTNRIVYLGSFSKLLLPSVRIGYMVLCDCFLKEYKKRLPEYNQTASKAEQLALAKYIGDNQLERHLRRLRKQYIEKSTLIIKSIRNFFGENTLVYLYETSLAISFTVATKKNADYIKAELLSQCVSVISVDNVSNGVNIKLGFSGIQGSKIYSAIELIYSIVAN